MLFGPLAGGNRSIGDIITDGHFPAANTAATKTIAAVAGRRHVIHKVVWSYSAAPTGGRLTITGSTVGLDIDITNGGPGVITLTRPMLVNTAMVITLAAGGGTVVGKLNFEYSTEVN